MTTLAPTRTACFGNEENCLRCQSTSPVDPNKAGYLLLGPRNGNARTSLLKALREAGVDYEDRGPLLALPLPGNGLSAFSNGFGRQLADATAQDVQGVLFSGTLDSDSRVLAAFIQAEPLAALLARAQHDWVRDALDGNWLFSVFHPILRAETGEVFGHEALIRARHPETGDMIGAGPIIDAAVALKLEHVLDQRARQAAIRNAAALRLTKKRIFINFMPNTIYDPEVCLRTTMETVQECDVDPAQLVFEVVETENIPDMKRLRTILDYYRSRGVGTAVDDMGAGFSSLQYLTALRPDFVKLDRDLVVRAEHEETARRNMDLIIRQAKRLEIQVIAEGIETEAQKEMCREAGADFLQGFLFGPPANPPQSKTDGLWPGGSETGAQRRERTNRPGR